MTDDRQITVSYKQLVWGKFQNSHLLMKIYHTPPIPIPTPKIIRSNTTIITSNQIPFHTCYNKGISFEQARMSPDNCTGNSLFSISMERRRRHVDLGSSKRCTYNWYFIIIGWSWYRSSNISRNLPMTVIMFLDFERIELLTNFLIIIFCFLINTIWKTLKSSASRFMFAVNKKNVHIETNQL